MRKFIITLLILLSFTLNQANAGQSKVIEAAETTVIKYDYNKSYELLKQTRELVNKYYYSIVFEKGDKNKIYSDIENKIVEYNKYSKLDRYSNEVKINDFLNNPDPQEIINTLGYHTLEYNRYNDYSSDNSLFIKEHKINLEKIKINDKIEGLYLGIKKDTIEHNSKYSYENPKKLKKIYTKYNKDLKVHFTKVDLDKYSGKIKIDISKIIKELDTTKGYRISFNFYLKKGDNYISLMYGPITDYFSFDEYTIKRSLERKYIEETNPRGNYYDSPVNEKLEENLNNKLRTIFDKIKSKKTGKEYLSFLETVKTKIATFTNDREKYDNLVKNIKDDKSFNMAYKKFKRFKDQEKIVTILLVFISNEIYENTLEDTISDFIK